MSRAFGNLLGVLGAGMVGYQRGQDMQAERERRKRADDYEERQRERTEREQKRQDEIRTSMTEAYAPTTVEAEPPKPDTMDDRDVGQPGEQSVGGYVAGGRMVDGYREGGQRYSTRAEADAAAAAYNAPAARTARMSDVLASRGEGVAAQNLRTAARQERLGEMQLSEAETAHVNKLFDQSLEGAATPDALADLISKSSIGGALQLKAVPSPDGKTFTFQRVNPDGSMSAASNPFQNTPQGLLEAKVGMSKTLPLAQKLDYIYKARTNEADLALKDAHATYYKKLADAAVTRADKAGGSKSTFERMDEADKLQFNNLNKTAQEIEGEIVKAQASNMWDANSPNAKALVARLAAVRMQATAILDKYAGDSVEKPDPVGIRGDGKSAAAPAAAPTTTTRPMTNMEKVMADMKATGVKSANVNLDGQRFTINAPGAAAPAPGAAPANAGPVPPARTGDATLNAIQEQAAKALEPLNAAVVQARQLLAAAAKSGDPQAQILYAKRLQEATNARDEAARRAFGNNADRYLQSLPQ